MNKTIRFLDFQSKLESLKIEQNEYVTKNSFHFGLYNAFLEK